MIAVDILVGVFLKDGKYTCHVAKMNQF